VGYGAGLRPGAALAGGAVGVVIAAGVNSWQLVVGGPDGQGVGRVAAGDPLAFVGVGWRSAVATSVHEQRVAASGAAAEVATAHVTATVVGLAAAGAGSRRTAHPHCTFSDNSAISAISFNLSSTY
jgi:hypothetical protein